MKALLVLRVYVTRRTTHYGERTAMYHLNRYAVETVRNNTVASLSTVEELKTSNCIAVCI